MTYSRRKLGSQEIFLVARINVLPSFPNPNPNPKVFLFLSGVQYLKSMVKSQSSVRCENFNNTIICCISTVNQSVFLILGIAT